MPIIISAPNFQGIVESFPEGIFEMTLEGKFTYANLKAFEISGYNQEDFEKGLSASQMFIPEDRTRAKKNIQAILSGEKMGGNEYTGLRKDGSTYPVVVHSSLIIDKNGVPLGLRGIIIDNTKMRMAEASRLESEKKYRELADALPEGVFEVDLQGKVTYCNQKLFEMVGSDPTNLALGVSAMDIIAPQERERAMQNMMASMKGEKKGGTQYTAVRTDGTTFPVIIYSSSVRDASGKPVGLRGLIIDISEIKMAEEALRENESKHRLLLENLPQKIFYKDKNSVYVSCNENYARDLKIKPHEIAGKTDYEFYPKDLADKYRKDDQRVIQSGKTEEIEEKYVINNVKEFVQTVKTPIKNEKGDCLGILGIFWDITERRRAAQALKESEEKWRSLVRDIPDMVLMVEPGGRILFVNRTIINLKVEDLVGKNIFDFLKVESDPNEVKLLLKMVIETGEIQSHEFRGPVASGELGWYSVHAGPVMIENMVFALLIVARDITEIKRMEKYRSEFVANISHELKTPLTAIRGYVETLLDGALEDKGHNRLFLEKVEAQSQYLSSLIDDILELSRLEGRVNLGQFSKIDIGATMCRAIENYSEKAGKKRINLVNKCLPESCYVEGAPELVYRAIRNLVDNALSYTDPGGKITVYCQKSEKGFGIVVEDTGIGIAREHIPRIFERFYRVEKARSREMGGTGLGLSIVKHVMGIHHGQVLVESELHKGSKFTLLFPLRQPS